jgi:hypothetical protein
MRPRLVSFTMMALLDDPASRPMALALAGCGLLESGRQVESARQAASFRPNRSMPAASNPIESLDETSMTGTAPPLIPGAEAAAVTGSALPITASCG